MTNTTSEAVLSAIKTAAKDAGRLMVGIAGPPGSGKSTYAAELAGRLGPGAVVVPMDGFHLDNATLQDMARLHRKGAPDTFDSAGFLRLVQELRAGGDVSYPTFDRKNDCTVPRGGKVDKAARIILVEGNYLFLQTPIWRELAPLFDVTVSLDVPRDVLRSRLVARWLAHGLTAAQAEARAEENDMKNVDIVLTQSADADYAVRQVDAG